MPKSKRVKLTKHSKERLNERTSYPNSVFKENAKYAFKNGVSLRNLSDDEKRDVRLFRSLMSKSKVTYKKFYKGYIYVFEHRGNVLITMYPMEDEELLEKLEKIYERKIKNKNRKG